MASGSISGGLKKYNKDVASGARAAHAKAKSGKSKPVHIGAGGYPSNWD